jgi:UDP-GlcNAc:undecaprenyl-phosphate GlcNAc-1-phosphate transferase
MENITNNYNLIFVLSIFNLVSYLFLNKYKSKLFYYLKDNPDKIRKLHSKPVLMIGGIFIATYFIFTSAYLFLNGHINYSIILLTSILVFIIGLIDDYYSLSALKKLFYLSIILLIALNIENSIRIETLYFSTFDRLLNVKNYSFFLTCLCILLLMNCLNLSDGINGLAVGISIIWIVFNIYYTNIFFIIILVPLIFLLILMFFSIFKEEFFLGDNGSLIISCFISLITIFNYNQNLLNGIRIISVENIFILFMLPGLDMFRLFLERIFKKKNPFKGDRNHLHHLLMNRFSLKLTLLIYLFIMIFFILIDQIKLIPSMYIIIFFVLFYSFFIKVLKRV